MNESETLFSLPTVADMLGMPAHKLRRLIREEKVPGATHLVSRRRIFTEADIDAIWMRLLVAETDAA